MKEHISEFEVAKNSSANKSSEAEKIKAELLRIDTDTKKLIDRLIDADDVLFGYIQEKIWWPLFMYPNNRTDVIIAVKYM